MFEPFPKLARLNREIVITEKIDGTNAQVLIVTGPEIYANRAAYDETKVIAKGWDHDCFMFAGSRTRLITPESDNYGFAAWAEANAEELFKLGPGRHFGEWWGQGIQRRYGLAEKRFSLFNTARWNANNLPACCSVVPVLYQGLFSEWAIQGAEERLRELGSVAAPGFMNPEGIVIYLTAAQTSFKVTLEADASPKSLVKAA